MRTEAVITRPPLEQLLVIGPSKLVVVKWSRAGGLCFANGARFSLASILLDHYDHSQDGDHNCLADLYWRPRSEGGREVGSLSICQMLGLHYHALL